MFKRKANPMIEHTSTTTQRDANPTEPAERIERLEQTVAQLTDRVEAIMDHMARTVSGTLFPQPLSHAQQAERESARATVRAIEEANSRRYRDAAANARAANAERAEALSSDLRARGHLAHLAEVEKEHGIADHLHTAMPADPVGAREWRQVERFAGTPEDGCCVHCCPVGIDLHHHVKTADVYIGR